MLVFEFAENGPHLAHHQFEHVDLLIEDPQHLVLDRACRHQIEHKHLTRLADPVDTTDTLLDRHRIPRDIEVDQRIAELQVAPLASGLAAQQHWRLGAESVDRRILGRA